MTNYTVRFSTAAHDILAAQEFRGGLFRGGAIDADVHDADAIHGLVTRDDDRALVCVFRMKKLTSGELDRSYSAQFYDLGAIKDADMTTLELGRFCVDPAVDDPNVIRLAWASLTEFVLENDIDLLFGCSSFHGADHAAHADALALLRARHLAPKGWLPRIKAPRIFEFAKSLARHKICLKSANKSMPPLLRSYLAMGGWVSDHAVVDHDLDTIHVFTGVEINKIPPARRKLFLGLRTNLRKGAV